MSLSSSTVVALDPHLCAPAPDPAHGPALGDVMDEALIHPSAELQDIFDVSIAH